MQLGGISTRPGVSGRIRLVPGASRPGRSQSGERSWWRGAPPPPTAERAAVVVNIRIAAADQQSSGIRWLFGDNGCYSWGE